MPAVVALLLALWNVLPVNAEPQAIGPIDAAHLLEREFPGAAIKAADLKQQGGKTIWEIQAAKGTTEYVAEVDATIARLLRVESAGKEVYRFPGVRVVAHRGNVNEAPENTLAAFEKAIAHGADLIEIDVRETKDGHLVILHDATVDRTTNGKGPIADMTLAEARALDAGSWFDPEFKGQRILTFEEALLALKDRATPDLDFKAGTPSKLIAALEKTGMLGRTTLYCGRWSLMQETVSLSPKFEIRPTAPKGLIGLARTVETFDPQLINIDWPEFSYELIRQVHLSGRKAFVNTLGVNDNEYGMLHAIEAGADYIQSDHLDVLIPLLRSRGLHD